MDIYEIRPDVKFCQWILPTDQDRMTLADMTFDGHPKESTWSPPEFYVYNPLEPRSDFFISYPGALAISRALREHDALAAFFERAGELLPVEMEEGEPVYLLNVTECVNAFDWGHAVMRPVPPGREPYRVERWAFHVRRLPGSSIFKVPIQNASNILAYTGRYEEEEEFLPMLWKHGIRGLKATKLWSGEAR